MRWGFACATFKDVLIRALHGLARATMVCLCLCLCRPERVRDATWADEKEEWWWWLRKIFTTDSISVAAARRRQGRGGVKNFKLTTMVIYTYYYG